MVASEILQNKVYSPIQQQHTRVRTRRDGAEGTGAESAGSANGTSFADTMKSFVGEVNQLQMDAGDANEKFIKGEPIDIHDVMIAAEKAKTSFQLLMEIRNKALDMYREVIRTPL